MTTVESFGAEIIFVRVDFKLRLHFFYDKLNIVPCAVLFWNLLIAVKESEKVNLIGMQ